MATLPTEDGVVLRVRIGVHAGEAVRQAGDFFGKTVVLASRIADLARGGEVLVSSLVRAACEGASEFSFGDGRDCELKGMTGSYQLHELRWA